MSLSPVSPSDPVPTPAGLSAELVPGARLFAVGEWWEAHEAWEGPWMKATGHERHFIQGLILLAAALHKRWYHGSLTHRNYHKAVLHLNRLPAGSGGGYGGVDVTRLCQEVWEALHQEGVRPALTTPAPTAEP